jgi:hypothetical protein
MFLRPIEVGKGMVRRKNYIFAPSLDQETEWWRVRKEAGQ